MPHAYEIEFEEPSPLRCDCCGGLTVRLTRFVYRDGDAFAVYYAAYSNNHPDSELVMLISLGTWGEGAEPSDRAAFYCRVRPTADSYEVMLGDAGDSLWGDAQIVGQKLSADEARQHPWKTAAFEVLDEAFAKDPSLRGFLKRTQCADAAVPLEKSFQMPDVLFALGDAREGRVELGRSFSSLDGKRFFVRCLVPVPVEDYGQWSIGLWIEVSKADYKRVRAAWDDKAEYPQLRFNGKVANDVVADLDLPVAQGVDVELHVTDADAPPMVSSSTDEALNAFVSARWSKLAFEQYAVARGFL